MLKMDERFILFPFLRILSLFYPQRNHSSQNTHSFSLFMLPFDSTVGSCSFRLITTVWDTAQHTRDNVVDPFLYDNSASLF